MAVDLESILKKSSELVNRATKSIGRLDRSLDPRIVVESPDLVGRAEETKEIARLFKEDSGPVAIAGAGGIGKTALSDHYARTFHVTRGRGNYVGAWRISGESVAASIEDLSSLAAHLGAPPDEHFDVLYADVLTKIDELTRENDKRWLLIHDNVDDEDAKRRLTTRFQFPHAVDHLVTTRLTDWGNRASLLRIETLSDSSAVELLAREAGFEPSSELKELAVKKLDKLPLALLLVGRDLRVTGTSAAEYSDSFEDILDQTPNGTHVYQRSISGAVLSSFDRLDNDAKGLMNLAAYLSPEDIRPDFFLDGSEGQSGTDTPVSDFLSDRIALKRAINAAAQFSLLQPNPNERSASAGQTHRIHRLTQKVLQNAMGEDQRQKMIGIVAQLGRVQIGDPQYDVENWPRYGHLTKHAEHLVPLVVDVTEDTADFVGSFLHLCALYAKEAIYDLSLVRRLNEACISIVATHMGRNSLQFSAASLNYGSLLEHTARGETNQDKREHLEELSLIQFSNALETAQDDLAASFVHAVLADFYQVRGDLDNAEPHLLECLRLRQAENNIKPEYIGSAHGNLGVLYSKCARKMADPITANLKKKTAAKHFLLGLEFTRKGQGDLSFATASILQNLGWSLAPTKERDRAMRLILRGAAIPLALEKAKITINQHEIEKRVGFLDKFLKSIGDERCAHSLAESEVQHVIDDHKDFMMGNKPNWPT